MTKSIKELCAPPSAQGDDPRKNASVARSAIYKANKVNPRDWSGRFSYFSEIAALHLDDMGFTVREIADTLNTYPNLVYKFLEKSRRSP